MLSLITLFQGVDEDVLYDVEPSFTNIPIEELVNYIIEQIDDQKMLIPTDFQKIVG